VRFDVVVVGAGAAGMMCAAEAGRRGRRVLLIEHAPKLGERIRISGGGRCNFTNRDAGPANYLSRNPDFCRSALARFTARDFIARIEQRGIRYHEKTLGQLFCDESSQQVIDFLVDAVDDAGVRWAHLCVVHRVTEQPAVGERVSGDPITQDRVGTGRASANAVGGRGKDRFELETDHGTFRCGSLVIATGGLAVPKLGATPFGYRLAEQFGLRIVAPRPGLVPLALAPQTLTMLAPISGVSFEAEVALAPAHDTRRVGRDAQWAPDNPRFREKVLVTHRGLSGPAILQISTYWQMQEYGRASSAKRDVTIDLFPGDDAAAWLAHRSRSRGLLSNVLAERLPRSFAQGWCALHGWVDQPVAELGSAGRERVAAALHGWTVSPSGTLGFGKAEVTLGGVDTGELSSKTMEARRVRGLYFVGEVVDVTGWLGGYNFQWAWSSGWVAGQFA
jgi:predicted Rossmann fold flavoprotein